MRRLAHPLAPILAIHIALGLAFGLVTPIFEAPDEANHFLFVRYLQIHHNLPVQTLDQDGPRAVHPPLYFVISAVVSAWVPNAGGADRVENRENPDLWFRYGDPGVDHKAKFLHPLDEGWPFRGQSLAVHVIRLLSTFFSALAVFFTYLVACELVPHQPLVAVLASALLAFNPMVLFMSGVVQNSTAALASSAGLLYALGYWIRRGFTPLRWALVGVLLSVAVLIQASGLTLAVPVAGCLAYDAWRIRRLRGLVINSLAMGVPVLILTGWWFVRNQLLYGDWTANSIIATLWSDQPIMPFEQTWHLIATGMIGRFGFGLIIEYADTVYRTAWLLALLAGLGLVLKLWLSWRSEGHWRLNDAATLWVMHGLTILVVTVALAAYIAWYIRGGHGRYMFTAYPSLAVLLAVGALAWSPKRWQRVATMIWASFSLALTVFGLLGLVVPAYAVPRSPSHRELTSMTHLDANIGSTARILGYSLSSEAVQPGQDLTVTAYWQPLSQTGVPYTVFVHLYDPNVGILTQQDTYPGKGNYATTIWDIGRPFVDTYRLTLPPDAPPTNQARILLGLYDRQTMQRLLVSGANAGPAEDSWVEFGNVQVLPAQ